MKNIDDFFKAVKSKSELASNYKIARKLGVSDQHVSNWQRRLAMPSNKHIIELCDIAKIDLSDAIRAIEYSREFERPMKEAGFSNVIMMSNLGLMSLLLMTQSSAIAGLASFIGLNSVYYVK